MGVNKARARRRGIEINDIVVIRYADRICGPNRVRSVPSPVVSIMAICRVVSRNAETSFCRKKLVMSQHRIPCRQARVRTSSSTTFGNTGAALPKAEERSQPDSSIKRCVLAVFPAAAPAGISSRCVIFGGAIGPPPTLRDVDGSLRGAPRHGRHRLHSAHRLTLQRAESTSRVGARNTSVILPCG